jgi:pimeloyl-ACP methyl ester carboxylesterase
MNDGSWCAGLTVTHHGRRGDSSPTLVLLHGLTDSGDCWPDAIRRWSADYHLVTVDARGHGESPRWSDEDLAHGVGETMRDDAIAVLEQLRSQSDSRPVLVGHSMGGATAWEVAVQRPDLVRALVLEDPAVPTVTPRGRRSAGQQAPERGQTDQPPERMGPWDWPAVELEPWARAKQQVDERMVATGLVCVDAPWPEVWAALTVPTLVVAGTEQVIMDGRHRRAIAELDNPHIRVRVVPHAGHCVRRCNPEGYHDVVDPFLAEVS